MPKIFEVVGKTEAVGDVEFTRDGGQLIVREVQIVTGHYRQVDLLARRVECMQNIEALQVEITKIDLLLARFV